MKNIMTIGISLLLFGVIACSKDDVTGDINEATDSEKVLKSSITGIKSSTVVFNAITGEVIGQSTLHRNSNGVTVNFKTTGLTPGHTYTLWWVIWNKPENCLVPGECVEADLANAGQVEVQLLYAAGSVAGYNGKGNFSAHISENDDTGSIHELFGLPNFGGMHNAQTAEIHLVLRSHGPKIPGQVNEQIKSYTGGCIIYLPAFTEIPDEVGECGDIYAAIHRL